MIDGLGQSAEAYEQLADALDRLPNAFPRTPSNVEIQLLRKMYTVEEASLASQLGGTMEPAGVIAERLGLSAKEASARLMKMAGRGQVWFDRQDGEAQFRLAPFIVGVYEAQLENMDHEFAHLFDKYMADGGAAGIMKPEPAIHRVVPAYSAIGSERILPYDDVRALLLTATAFRVRDCICRVQQDNVGRQCDFPVDVCLIFSSSERPPSQDEISQKEALALLDRVEAIGLVHTVSNVMEGLGYVCNCCGCCCAILRGITEWGIENSVAHARYYAVIDPDDCVGCGTCITRCQVHAISEQGGVAVVDRQRCIGCGLCVTGCPSDTAKLQRKPEADTTYPPKDYATWEHGRLLNRGL